MKITLGPLQYYWPRNSVFAFYEAMADTAVDEIYLGETVCSRRHELRLSDWLGLARHLQGKGKQVVMSSQVLLESGSDVAWLQKLAANGEFTVEANDMGAVHCLAGKQPFVAGPHLNLYNPQAVQWMAQLGASRWVMPLEMRHQDLAVVQAARPAGLQTEVFAYGRLPLAYLGPLLHRAALQPAQGRLPLQLHGTPRRPAHAHAREGRLPRAQRHANAVGPRLQPA